jgi:hypothetical protein
VPCSTLNHGCEITTNSKQLAGPVKWEDILKLYETKKQTVPDHLLLTVMHSSETWLIEYDESKLS